MIDEKHYVPILKGKMGEYRALKELTPDVRKRLTPIIEIPPIAWDYINDIPAKTIDQHLSKVPENLFSSWNENRPIFLELVYLETESMSDGTHPLTKIFNEMRIKHFPAIPVTGISRVTEYQQAVIEIIENDKLGVCLRLTSRDLDDDDLEDKIEDLLSSLKVQFDQVDLVLDIESISSEQIGLQARAIRSYLTDLPNIREWRSLILSCSSFPETLGAFERNTTSATTRAEWLIWASLAGGRSRIARLPTFSDYTVVHPEPFEMDPRFMQMGAKIKYTYEEEWLIVKGESIKRKGAEQTHRLCRRLVESPEYSGRDYSWGDEYINSCALKETGPGNQTTWVRVGVNHHITFVVRQLASFFEP